MYQTLTQPLPSIYNLNIPKKVTDKIQYLCKEFPNTEWSGILFYSVTGSIINKDLQLECQDILLMDIGNSSYTEFDYSAEVINYMTNNIELLDCYTGLIHSHHTMDTFFSHTDLNTLKSEGKEGFHFVSLIVNNHKEYNACITYKHKYTKVIKSTFTTLTFDNKEIPSPNESIKSENTENITYEYLNIVPEFGNVVPIFPEIKIKIDKIRKQKREEEEKRISHSPYNQLSILDNLNPYYKNKYNYGYKNTYLKKENNSEEVYKEDIIVIIKRLLSGNNCINNTNHVPIKHYVQKLKFKFKNTEEFQIWLDYYIDCVLWDFSNIIYIDDVSDSIIHELLPFKAHPYIQTLIATLK